MFGRCDVWGWSGHIWETPKHNKALGNIDVIDKCRCGETRTRTVFVPLPDMEPVEGQEEPGLAFPFDVVRIVIGMVILIFIMTTFLPMITNMANGCYPTNQTWC